MKPYYNLPKYTESKRRIISEVLYAVVEHGQRDKQFKIGETIRYSPNDICNILYDAWDCKPKE